MIHKEKTTLINDVVLSVLVFVVICTWIGCGKLAEEGEKYTPDPNIFTKEPSEESIVSLDVVDEESAETVTLRFPVDQLLVMAEEGVDPAAMEAAAQDLGGTLVGQIPPINCYQFQFPITTIAELDQKAEAARERSEVESAGYNLLAEIYDSSPQFTKCLADGDNDALENEQRCAFERIGYYSLVPIMDEVKSKSMTSLNDVKIAVLDSGLEGMWFKSDATLIDLDGGELKHSTDTAHDMHGTKVIGLIAAKDKDGSINGLASRILGKHLKLYFSVMNTNPLALATVAGYAVQAVTRAKVDFVHMSLGWRLLQNSNIADSMNLTTSRKVWEKILNKYENVTFIAAAPNEPFKIRPHNAVPVGITSDNIIAVGGTQACDSMARYESTAYGPYIQISAPAKGVPVINPIDINGAPKLVEGNSFAAPMVTSTAAILKSIKPELKPKEIRDYLVYNAGPTHANPEAPEEIDPFLDMAEPVVKLLLDMEKGEELFDRDMDGETDGIGIIKSRLCSETYLSVEGLGSYHFESQMDQDDWGEQSYAAATITSENITISMSEDDSVEHVFFQIEIYKPFEIGKNYNLPEEGEASFLWQKKDGTEMLIGNSAVDLEDQSGVVLTSCAILDRKEVNGVSLPILLQVEGMYAGQLVISEGLIDETAANYNANSFFNFPTVVQFSLPEDAELVEQLEVSCLNGLFVMH